MSRLRTIKPDFWTDEKLTECSLSARLLFIGLWNFADDFGNLARSAKKIKMQVFPADAIDCEPLLQELIAQGVLTEYSVSDEKFLQIKNFLKHQVINRPSKTSIPQPTLMDYSRSTHGVITEDSCWSGKERIGVIAASPPPPTTPDSPNPVSQVVQKLGTRLPERWQPDDALRKWSESERPDLDIDSALASFVDHWRSVPGKAGVKLDWAATWRNWVRSQRAPLRPVRLGVPAQLAGAL